MDGFSFQTGDAGITLPQAQVGALQGRGVKADAGGVVEHLGMGIVYQHVNRIHAQLSTGLLEENVEGQTQVEAGSDRHVNHVQGLELVKAAGCFFEQACIFQSDRGAFGQQLAGSDLLGGRRVQCEFAEGDESDCPPCADHWVGEESADVGADKNGAYSRRIAINIRNDNGLSAFERVPKDRQFQWNAQFRRRRGGQAGLRGEDGLIGDRVYQHHRASGAFHERSGARDQNIQYWAGFVQGCDFNAEFRDRSEALSASLLGRVQARVLQGNRDGCSGGFDNLNVFLAKSGDLVTQQVKNTDNCVSCQERRRHCRAYPVVQAGNGQPAFVFRHIRGNRCLFMAGSPTGQT